MNLKLNHNEIDLLISCVSSDKEASSYTVMHFDESQHDEMLSRLYAADAGNDDKELKTYLVKAVLDNGCVIKKYNAVCVAISEDDAKAQVREKLEQHSCDTVMFKSVAEMPDGMVICEEVQ